MPRKNLGVAVALAAIILVVSAAAQETKNELAGSIGRVFVSDQGVPNAPTFDNAVHFGNGLSFEIVYGRHLLGGNGGFAALTLEVPFVYDPVEKLNFGLNVVPKQYSALFLAPDARLNLFASTAVSPWVSFGGGFGHFGESSDLLFFGKNPGTTGTTTGVYQVGVGLDVKIWNRFSVRGEARDYNSGVPQLNVNTGKSRQHNYFAGGGVVWHF